MQFKDPERLASLTLKVRTLLRVKFNLTSDAVLTRSCILALTDDFSFR
ncbi:hypothetical protein PHET_09558 [Paragonimus heterotremus]|uniref:Uncharacterized protein n=1 Tax=Paragonimus heterotremus TaxID=100268 RepID=A0A8J4TAP6_9TREM|nr:hypothetical protein PHET_09558 [Paragonimus heterotremus]